jgi:hypothetical protein
MWSIRLQLSIFWRIDQKALICFQIKVLFSKAIYAFAGLCQQEIPTGTSLMGWLCWCGAIEHKAQVSFFWSTLCCFNTNVWRSHYTYMWLLTVEQAWSKLQARSITLRSWVSDYAMPWNDNCNYMGMTMEQLWKLICTLWFSEMCRFQNPFSNCSAARWITCFFKFQTVDI